MGRGNSVRGSVSRGEKRGRGEEAWDTTSVASTSSTTVSAEFTTGFRYQQHNQHHTHTNRQRLGNADESRLMSQQDYSHREQQQQQQQQRDAKREQRLKRLQAIKDTEKSFTHLTAQYILGESDGLNLPGESGSIGMPLKKPDETAHAYSTRVTTTVYQKLYNKLMHQSQIGSSYSFNKRTSGNPLDTTGLVFMKDMDIDHITKQAISIAFRKLQSSRNSARRHWQHQSLTAATFFLLTLSAWLLSYFLFLQRNCICRFVPLSSYYGCGLFAGYSKVPTKWFQNTLFRLYLSLSACCRGWS